MAKQFTLKWWYIIVIGMIVVIMIGKTHTGRKASQLGCGIGTPVCSDQAIVENERAWCVQEGKTCQNIYQNGQQWCLSCTMGSSNPTCTDTDGSGTYVSTLNIYEQGTITLTGGNDLPLTDGTYTDYCLPEGSTRDLREYFCIDPTAGFGTHGISDSDCPTGYNCQDGACVPAGPEWCMDTDSNTYPTDNKDVKGTLTFQKADGSTGSRTDTCQTTTSVNEYVCLVSATSSSWNPVLKACDAGQICSDGACVTETCTESDWDIPPCGMYTLGEWSTFVSLWSSGSKTNVIFAQIANKYFGG